MEKIDKLKEAIRDVYDDAESEIESLQIQLIIDNKAIIGHEFKYIPSRNFGKKSDSVYVVTGLTIVNCEGEIQPCVICKIKDKPKKFIFSASYFNYQTDMKIVTPRLKKNTIELLKIGTLIHELCMVEKNRIISNLRSQVGSTGAEE